MNVSKAVDGGPGELHVNSVAPEQKRRRRRRPVRVDKSSGPGSVYQGGRPKPARDKDGKFARKGAGTPGKIVGDNDGDFRRRAEAREASHAAARKRLVHRLALFGGMAAATEGLSNSRLNRHHKIDDSDGTVEFRYGFGERNRGMRTYVRPRGYYERVYGRTPIVGGKRWKVEMDNRDGVSRAVYLSVPNLWNVRRRRSGKGIPGEGPIGKRLPLAAVLADIQHGTIVKTAAFTLSDTLADIAARRLDPAADVAVELSEPVAKHPGHSDQSIHAVRHGEDRGRRTIGKKPANRGRRNRQGHDSMGRYTARSVKRNRRRMIRIGGALAAGGILGGGGIKYHDQGQKLFHAYRENQRLRNNQAGQPDRRNL